MQSGGKIPSHVKNIVRTVKKLTRVTTTHTHPVHNAKVPHTHGISTPTTEELAERSNLPNSELAPTQQEATREHEEQDDSQIPVPGPLSAMIATKKGT